MTEVIPPKVIKWAERINAAYKEGVVGILKTAATVLAAREDCTEHGEWEQLIGRDLLVFKRRHCFRFLAIGRSLERFQRVPHEALLPSDTNTLEYLTRLTDDRFEELLADGTICPSMKRNEASAETRKERKERDEQRILSLESVDERFPTLVVDPPWDYEWLSPAGRAAPGYATMTHDELLALEVDRWVDVSSGGAHMYLWTTNNFMTRAVELMATWGFQHKTVLTWVKPRWGLGSYFRNSTEHVLFGVRGELPTRVDNIATHFEAPVGEHSAKPEAFYALVESLCPGSKCELFARTKREGWVQHGSGQLKVAA